jgi:hypothetical protein
MHRYNHTLGLGKYPHPLQKRLGESHPKVEENNLRRKPAKGMARAPVAAAAGETRGLGLELPGGQPDPPLLYQAITPAGLSGQDDPGNPPPRIFRPGGGADILAWEPKNRPLEIFQKQKLF